MLHGSSQLSFVAGIVYARIHLRAENRKDSEKETVSANHRRASEKKATRRGESWRSTFGGWRGRGPLTYHKMRISSFPLACLCFAVFALYTHAMPAVPLAFNTPTCTTPTTPTTTVLSDFLFECRLVAPYTPSTHAVSPTLRMRGGSWGGAKGRRAKRGDKAEGSRASNSKSERQEIVYYNQARYIPRNTQHNLVY